MQYVPKVETYRNPLIMNTSKILVILLALSLSVTTFFGYTYFTTSDSEVSVNVPADQQEVSTETTQKTQLTTEENETNNEMLAMYKNSKYSVSFSYPKAYSLEENEVDYDGRMQVILNKGKANSVSISINTDTSRSIQYHLDNSAVKTESINGVDWNVFEVDGHQNVYKTKTSNGVYTFIAYETEQLTAEQAAILRSISIK